MPSISVLCYIALVSNRHELLAVGLVDMCFERSFFLRLLQRLGRASVLHGLVIRA